MAPCKFVVIDICPPNAQEPIAAVTMGRSEVIKMFERGAGADKVSISSAWKTAYKLFLAYNWEPGNAMELPHGLGWLFSVHQHVEL